MGGMLRRLHVSNFKAKHSEQTPIVMHLVHRDYCLNTTPDDGDLDD